MFKKIYQFIALSLASGLFSRFLPEKIIKQSGKGAGLIASLLTAGVQIVLLIKGYGLSLMLTLAIISFIIGLITIPAAEEYIRKRYKQRKNHVGEIISHDFNETTIDEIHGQCVAGLPIFWAAYLDMSTRITLLLLALLLFRIFDVKKPWIVGKAERYFHGSSFGAMIDDTLAGFFSALIVLGVILLL